MSPQNPKIESLLLPLANNISIAGIRQREPGSESTTPVLCLHGWLDNANSFVPMMPYLPDMDLVALDLPGHGHSSHIAGPYNLLDTAVRCLEIADVLQWQQFHVVGHSLGGSIALMLATAAPSRVLSTTSIESAGALSEPTAGFANRLQKAANDRSNPTRFASRTFAHWHDAVESRLKAAKMDRLSAELIVRRQLHDTEQGLQWRFDPALRNTSLSYLAETQVEAALAAIECPVHVVIASDGFIVHREELATRLGCIKQLEITELPGNHHLHMDTPEPIAAAINRFLGTKPALGG